MARSIVVVSVALVLAGCAERVNAPDIRAERTPVAFRPYAPASLEDPYPTAAWYVGHPDLDPLPYTPTELNSNPELATDSEFESIGYGVVDSQEEVKYEGDGFYVLYNTGGGGGGEDPPDEEMMMGDRYDDLYEGFTSRCRRIRSIKGRALCWAAAMAAYAACRAYES